VDIGKGSVLCNRNPFHTHELKDGEEGDYKGSEGGVLGQQAGESENLIPVGSLDNHLHLIDDGGSIVGDITYDEFFRQAAQDEVERVPDIEPIDWCERTFLDRGPTA